jgi:glycosyltransferase involved in cell wall biosynthesis
MKTAPLISVLLPVRNGVHYLDVAMRSLLTQSLADFEVIAVDDGSTDDTSVRLLAWKERDPRVRIVTLGGVGPAGALNAAINCARGEFFARMDADDISLPGRFSEQVACLKANPRVGVCGTWVKTFGDGGIHTWRYPQADQDIRARLFFSSPFAHPSVIIRRSALDLLPEAYRLDAGRAEDYDLWMRLSKVCEFRNLPRVRLRYRLHSQQVTVKEGASSEAGARRVCASMLEEWWPECTDADKQFHHLLCRDQLPVTAEHLLASEQWLLRLWGQNRRVSYVSQGAWRDALAVKWLEVCRHFHPMGLHMLAHFFKSPLAHFTSIPAHRLTRLLIEGVTMEIKGRRQT